MTAPAATDAAEGGSLPRAASAVPPSAWGPSFLVPLAVAVLIALLVPLFAGPFLLTLLGQAAIYAIVVLGLNVLVGYTGQISFGHNAFFGVGGYTTALATTSWNLSPIMGLLLGVVAAAVLASVIGYPTLRLRGHYLALGTFAFGLAFYSFVVASPIFNGFIGIGGIPALAVGPFVSTDPLDRYTITTAFMFVGIIAAWRLRHRRFGRALRSVASDEATAESIGVATNRYKLSAFVISAVFAAVAGWLYAHTVNYVSPETFGFALIISLFTMLFLGGVASVWGAVVGAIVFTVIPPLAPTEIQSWQPTIFAVALLIIVILRPTGLLGGLSSTGATEKLRTKVLGKFHRG